MPQIEINNLLSGGLITNYHCTSQCKHCLYFCSPSRDKSYITETITKKNFENIKNLGCHSIHIGGGEPFLNHSSLINVAKEAKEAGISIDYIETNSSWYNTEEEALNLLTQLKTFSISTLLISISPFHNEYIPLHKVKDVMNACKKVGLNIFPWIMKFYDEIEALGIDSTHSPEEFKDKYGEDYFENIPDDYWIHYGGRALSSFSKEKSLIPLTEILRSSRPCLEIENTSHFHIDLYGNYIPGLCSGLSILVEDLPSSISKSKYPIINLLYSQGVKSFYESVKRSHGYEPMKEYLNKCHLCYDIRLFLVKEAGLISQELQPIEFYLKD